MADKKPLVAGQSPAVVQQIGSGDALDVPEIKLGTPLAPQYGGLGVDASLWASGKIPVFDGSQFAPGDPSGGSLPAGEKDQILVMGASGPEWGGSFPIVGGWVPPLEFVGMYQEWNYYTTSQAVFAMANDYGTLTGTYLTPINNGTPSYPELDYNVRRLWDTNPPEPYHEWQELAWPVSPPHFALGQSTYAGDGATAVGQFTSAGFGATAVGQYTNASDGGTAVGQFTSAGFGATAVGIQATATDISIAIGLGSSSVATGSTAIGFAAFAQHERAAVLGAVDGNVSYQPSTTADRRMTVDYQEIEVINQGEGGQTAVILVDEIGGQWRITVNSSGVISASAV